MEGFPIYRTFYLNTFRIVSKVYRGRRHWAVKTVTLQCTTTALCNTAGSYTITGHSWLSEELRRTCDVSRGYRRSTGTTGAQQGLETLNRVYRHSTWSKRSQKSTGAQKDLQEFYNLQARNRDYRHSTGSKSIQKSTGTQQDLRVCISLQAPNRI